MNISDKHSVAMDLLASISEGRISLGTVAEQKGVSLSSLEHLAAALRRGGMVRSTRGPGGGYELTRPLSEIKLVELLKTVGMNEQGHKSVLFKAILHNLGGVTVAQALTTANS
ncbi:HTH-type transcriptional regulator iscR [Citrobacter werkmanii]|uniref:HTH-type transcriptional regulator iscR n=1 Tax=Citrobacter werkmanii TaxID=67827 RepID=A0A9N8CXI6_9ENTR|nr:Rrf2 family transcriptional regulator [Citrobacter werkmanii]CAB5549557.1 HTH-type transcriptional regulator iscR [Citrobacter werkmanii]CAB5577636.1 HTH-type transcriptional regulator iscR [Citrobacter werkmanii]CAB5591380.1 HTH-type transcriptional regulator iscR [Citrobacter werkmanii]CAB5591916.1 HTH-type transcriptional regulator iscR [Citrobacter werkmanii]CAB5592218.1 HTH-type transcriptional regulator iscR [Citrobacter werkmanii]